MHSPCGTATRPCCRVVASAQGVVVATQTSLHIIGARIVEPKNSRRSHGQQIVARVSQNSACIPRTSTGLVPEVCDCPQGPSVSRLGTSQHRASRSRCEVAWLGRLAQMSASVGAVARCAPARRARPCRGEQWCRGERIVKEGSAKREPSLRTFCVFRHDPPMRARVLFKMWGEAGPITHQSPDGRRHRRAVGGAPATRRGQRSRVSRPAAPLHGAARRIVSPDTRRARARAPGATATRAARTMSSAWARNSFQRRLADKARGGARMWSRCPPHVGALCWEGPGGGSSSLKVLRRGSGRGGGGRRVAARGSGARDLPRAPQDLTVSSVGVRVGGSGLDPSFEAAAFRVRSPVNWQSAEDDSAGGALERCLMVPAPMFAGRPTGEVLHPPECKHSARVGVGATECRADQSLERPFPAQIPADTTSARTFREPSCRPHLCCDGASPLKPARSVEVCQRGRSLQDVACDSARAETPRSQVPTVFHAELALIIVGCGVRREGDEVLKRPLQTPQWTSTSASDMHIGGGSEFEWHRAR